MTATQEEALRNLLKSNAHCFSCGRNHLGVTDLGSMKIQLTTEKPLPVYHQPYRLAASERKLVREKVDKLLQGGVIRESSSEYASLVILVPKKNVCALQSVKRNHGE